MIGQPEALRLADSLESAALKSKELLEEEDQQAATELRRLHEVNQELLEALQEIATAFVSETAPEAYLMQTARNAIAKATGESK